MKKLDGFVRSLWQEGPDMRWAAVSHIEFMDCVHI